MRPWLLLAYNVPPKPTAGRVYVWRKLKKLGAMLLHDALWVLPATPQTREHFRWLAAEIDELGGEATLWESRLLLDGHDATLTRRFNAAAEDEYRIILAALGRKRPDLATLARRYQQAKAQDYFGAELGAHVREALLKARGRTKR